MTLRGRVIRTPTVIFRSRRSLTSTFGTNLLRGSFITIVHFRNPHSGNVPRLRGVAPFLNILRSHNFGITLIASNHVSNTSKGVPTTVRIDPRTFINNTLTHIRRNSVVHISNIGNALRLGISTRRFTTHRPTGNLLTGGVNDKHRLFNFVHVTFDSTRRNTDTFASTLRALGQG